MPGIISKPAVLAKLVPRFCFRNIYPHLPRIFVLSIYPDYQSCHFAVVCSVFSSFGAVCPILLAIILAAIAPEILCQALKIAPGTVARARDGKQEAASVEAMPEFCIPTSMEMALRLAGDILKTVPIRNPRR